MPIEIFLDDKFVTNLGPERQGFVVPDLASITWSGDTKGKIKITRLDTKIAVEKDVPDDLDRVFHINKSYAQYCKGKPLFYEHEIVVRKCNTDQSI